MTKCSGSAGLFVYEVSQDAWVRRIPRNSRPAEASNLEYAGISERPMVRRDAGAANVTNMNTDKDFSIVAVDKFIWATRDSGYKGTPSAVAELVDNALQAGATEVSVRLTVDDRQREYPLVLSVLDNGSGMDAFTMRMALRFGGSTRFNDRRGLGRYGMGLPNSSLSQAKRVTVHSWGSANGAVLESYLDIDEIASGRITEVPEPKTVARPHFVNGHPTGTAITWTRCDRLENRRVSTLVRKLSIALGRQFRHFLWDGVSIDVNGDPVESLDPLFLHPSGRLSGAAQFCDDFVYEIVADPDDRQRTGTVRVRFSELPVGEWSGLSNSEKRSRGISKGAGVSVVRAGREVDYGWFFLGGKRRENYDDWWRCEIQFDPVLDEAFGITHTKQQIRPRPHLLEALASDMEAMARLLNARARKAHQEAKLAERFSESEGRATEKDGMLTPLPRIPRSRDKRLLAILGQGARWMPRGARSDGARVSYRIMSAALSETAFFNCVREDGRLLLVLNPEHPFYKTMYGRLLDSESSQDAALRSQIELLLLAAARTEALLDDEQAIQTVEAFRNGWSDALATFLNG